MSFLLTKETAVKAVKMVLPMIEAMQATSQVNSHHLHVVILNPLNPFNGVTSFEDTILYEQSLGEKKEWADRYDQYARNKAETSWRTGMPTLAVQQMYPYLYQEGDTRFAGSAVLPGGLVVGVSGVQWFYDQFFAETVANACKALCIGQMRNIIKSEQTHLRHS